MGSFHTFLLRIPGALSAAPFQSPTSNVLVMTPSVTSAIGIDGQGLKGFNRGQKMHLFLLCFAVIIFATLHKLGNFLRL